MILLCGAIGSYLAVSPWNLIIAFVVGHFFLFCNVFRIVRRSELFWAGAFVIMTGGTLMTEIPGWPITIAASLFLTAGLIVLEMTQPHYHGIFWKRVNPSLREWWEKQS